MSRYVSWILARSLYYSKSSSVLAGRHLHAFSTKNTLPMTSYIIAAIDKVSVDDFRCEAFIPQLPRLITSGVEPDTNTSAHCNIPAVRKWFVGEPHGGHTLNFQYLEQYRDVMLPYELVDNTAEKSIDGQTFQRFNAPLEFFLTACRLSSPPQLYIAQAQLLSLPQSLRDDLPTPPVVLEAGKGDIYDANIWMGIPPTYTPLHRDPNPNLFLQLASIKVVRLFKPDIGATIFYKVQEKICNHALAAFRGEEMMQGPERNALEDAVWNCPQDTDGFEVVVRPGDALFIPKGWWHSIKSIGNDVTASVNWWFR